MNTTTEKIVCFNDETMLLAWGESNTRGRTVTFLLSEDGEEHPFRHFTVKTGKHTGQRFLMTLVQLDDNEEPVAKTAAQMAYLLCKDEQFWHWCSEHSFVTVDSEETCRMHVLQTCGVDSRAKLDTNSRARATWEAMLYQPFTKYRENLKGGL